MAQHVVDKKPIGCIDAGRWNNIQNAYDSDLNSYATCKAYSDCWLNFDFALPSDATVNSLTLKFKASGGTTLQPRLANQNKAQSSFYENISVGTSVSDYSWVPDLDKIVAESKLGFANKVALINGLVTRLRWTTSSKTVNLYNVYVTLDYTLPEYSVSVSAGAGGTVTGGGTYESGTSITIKAIPNSGYKFVKWSDGNTSATRTVTVTGNATYTAEFAALAAYVTYDSIFSLLSWRKYGITGSNATVSNISNTGFTLTSNAGVVEGMAASHYFPVEAGKSYKIDIDITGDNWDVYIFFCDESGSWVDFADSKNRFSSGGGGVANRVFTAPSGSVKAQIRVDANGASNTVSYSNFRIYPADCEYMSDSVSAAERTDIGSWNMPMPTRSGYTFVGWNTKPDGSGTTYTSSSSFPAEDMTLYSIWQAPPEITSVAMTYGGKQISQTNKVPAGEGYLISVGIK